MKTYPFKCPRCGYMRLERIGDWEGCERRQCGYEKSGSSTRLGHSGFAGDARCILAEPDTGATTMTAPQERTSLFPAHTSSNRRSIIEEARLCYEAAMEQMVLSYPNLSIRDWDDQDATVREAWIEHITPEGVYFGSAFDAENTAAIRGGVAVCGDSPTVATAGLPGAGCGEVIETVDDLYRCTDCDMALHKDCAVTHFGRKS